VLVNLSGESITEYGLSLSESILADGELNLTSMLDSASPATLETRDGKFTGYQPLPELPPYQAYIFQIK
jgi:hypothetical protein